MDISPNTLRQETLSTLKLADGGLKSSNLSDETRAALLLTKAQCLNTLVMLQGQDNKKKR